MGLCNGLHLLQKVCSRRGESYTHQTGLVHRLGDPRQPWRVGTAGWGILYVLVDAPKRVAGEFNNSKAGSYFFKSKI